MNKLILGSRSYGLNLPTSDTDIGLILPNDELVDVGPRPSLDVDRHMNTRSEFISDMFGPFPRWFFCQYLFPDSFLEEDTFSKYVLEKREEIIKAKLPIVFSTFKRRADGMRRFADKIYEVRPKRMAYSTLFYSILANYADGMTFAEAHKPEGELHDFLIGMRTGQVSLEDAVARNNLEKQRVEKVAAFYKESIHPEVLLDFKQVILDESKKELIL